MTPAVIVYAVRHGESVWNAAGRITGWSDVELTPRGVAQARAAGALLSGVGFDAVWSSDLRRAADTARIALSEATPDPRLRELDFGELDGKPWSAIESWAGRQAGDLDTFGAPGGESLQDLTARVRHFLDALRPGTHAVFCHGGVVRCMLAMLDAASFVPNCAIAHFDWSSRVLHSVRVPELPQGPA